ncbi:MAG: hypothetical protein ABTD50_22185 [Polyangiaceae bacterium]
MVQWNRQTTFVERVSHSLPVVVGVSMMSGCGSSGTENPGEGDAHVGLLDASYLPADGGAVWAPSAESGSYEGADAAAPQDAQAHAAHSDATGDPVEATTTDADLDGPSRRTGDAGPPTTPVDAMPQEDAASVGRPGEPEGGSAPDGDTNVPGDGAPDGPASLSDASPTDCAGGWTGRSSTDTSSPTPASGYGGVQIKIPTTGHIVGLHTVLTVPAKPPEAGTLFLWPGLQPLPTSVDFDPIGNGVLQPVLTWGGTCAPNSPRTDVYASWWISGQYVNTYADYTGHTGCNGGEGMDVAVGDSLDISMTLDATVWNQVVLDTQSGQQVSYAIDMLGQAQNWAIFSIEGHNQEPVTDVVFTSTTLTLSSPQTSSCQPSVRGLDDYFSAPMASSDGLECCISRIVLRAQGVAATTPNSP